MQTLIVGSLKEVSVASVKASLGGVGLRLASTKMSVWEFLTSSFYFVLLTLVGSYFIKGLVIRIATRAGLYSLPLKFWAPDIQNLLYACILILVQIYILFRRGIEKHAQFCRLTVIFPLVVLTVAYLFKFMYLYYAMEILPSDTLITFGIIAKGILISRAFWTFDRAFVWCMLLFLAFMILMVRIFGLNPVYLAFFNIWRFLILAIVVGYVVDIAIIMYVHNHTFTEWLVYYFTFDMHILVYGAIVIAAIFAIGLFFACIRPPIVKPPQSDPEAE